MDAFLHANGEQKLTHTSIHDVSYEGQGLKPISFANTEVFFDFNGHDSSRILINALAYAPNEYYEDFRPLYQDFRFDSASKSLVITGQGSYGKYKLTIH